MLLWRQAGYPLRKVDRVYKAWNGPISSLPRLVYTVLRHSLLLIMKEN